MASVAVSGAGGWLGRCICQRLTNLHHTVLALDRVGTPKGPWHDFAAIDLSNDRGPPGGWQDRIKGADAFVHCAGYAHRPVESPEEVQKFFQVNREGTRLVLDACRVEGVRRFTYLGTIAAYSWANEKAAAEDGLLEAKT